MKDDPTLLRLMMNDMQGQSGLYQPGPYWKGYAERTATAIQKHGLTKFRSCSTISKGYGDSAVSDPLAHVAHPFLRAARVAATLPGVRQVRSLYTGHIAKQTRMIQHYKSLYFQVTVGNWFDGYAASYDLPISTVGAPERQIEIGSTSIGESYLRAFVWADLLARHLDLTTTRTVFEIGGGFGALAHTLLHQFSGIRKFLYLDVPPILYVGTQYLKHFFGDAVVDYAMTRDQPDLAFSDGGELEILAICPWQLERFEGSVDIFWNSSSFQEMEEPMVANYLHHIDRLVAESGIVGLYAYSSGDPNRTLPIDALFDVIRMNSGFTLEEVSSEASDRVLTGRCVIGRRGHGAVSGDTAEAS